MFFKLFALSLVVANPTPLATKTTEGRWYQLGNIAGTDRKKIDAFIRHVGGLTIKDFKGIKDLGYEHDGYHLDTAYKLTLDSIDPFTTFYERFR